MKRSIGNNREIQKRRPGHKVEIIPVVLGCMGEGATRLKGQIRRVLHSDEKMIQRIWRESESMIRKVLSKIITAH